MKETVQDIVREMRKLADNSEQGDDYSVATDTLRIYADRIEAAQWRDALAKASGESEVTK